MKHLLSVACVALVVAGCGALVGPATKLDDSYLLTCGSEKCDPRYWTCSPPWYQPVHCVSAAGVSQDAGADR